MEHHYLYHQAKTTPMYKDASTEEYITTIVLPIITDKVGTDFLSSIFFTRKIYIQLLYLLFFLCVIFTPAHSLNHLTHVTGIILNSYTLPLNFIFKSLSLTPVYHIFVYIHTYISYILFISFPVLFLYQSCIISQKANWTKSSTLQQDKGSFLGVAAVDIEAKSLGQYPLSNARGCYSITVDVKGQHFTCPLVYTRKCLNNLIRASMITDTDD